MVLIERRLMDREWVVIRFIRLVERESFTCSALILFRYFVYILVITAETIDQEGRPRSGRMK